MIKNFPNLSSFQQWSKFYSILKTRGVILCQSYLLSTAESQIENATSWAEWSSRLQKRSSNNGTGMKFGVMVLKRCLINLDHLTIWKSKMAAIFQDGRRTSLLKSILPEICGVITNQKGCEVDFHVTGACWNQWATCNNLLNGGHFPRWLPNFHPKLFLVIRMPVKA